MDRSIDVHLLEWAQDPERPALIIDERRFGPPRFSEERIVFAAVLTTVGDVLRFGAATERLRCTLDAQKKGKALKSADVLSGPHAQRLQTAAVALLAKAKVSFWATSEPYLRSEFEARGSIPVAIDKNSGEHLSAKELPVFQMISGLAAEKASIQAAGLLEVFVDRSLQNGLHQTQSDILRVYDVDPLGAPATRGGNPVRLGVGVRQRWFPVCEETKMLGDWLVPADLCAHLWGDNELAVARLGGTQLTHSIEFIGDADGVLLVEELFKANTRRRDHELAKKFQKPPTKSERKAARKDMVARVANAPSKSRS